MQRWLGKLRPLAITATENLPFLTATHRSFLHSSSSQLNQPVSFTVNNNSIFNPLLNGVLSRTQGRRMLDLGFQSSYNSLFLNQSRHFSSKERKRKPGTPETSKLKKTKMKFYSSFKMRFRPMHDGQIRRWRSGKRHNAHLKSKIAKRRLRLPALVHPAYAKVMKKLNFC